MLYKDLIDDPSFPHWGRSIILETLRTDRDPVDTVNVLEVITEAAKDELRVLEFTPLDEQEAPADPPLAWDRAYR